MAYTVINYMLIQCCVKLMARPQHTHWNLPTIYTQDQLYNPATPRRTKNLPTLPIGLARTYLCWLIIILHFKNVRGYVYWKSSTFPWGFDSHIYGGVTWPRKSDHKPRNSNYFENFHADLILAMLYHAWHYALHTDIENCWTNGRAPLGTRLSVKHMQINQGNFWQFVIVENTRGVYCCTSCQF